MYCPLDLPNKNLNNNQMTARAIYLSFRTKYILYVDIDEIIELSFL